MRFRKGREQLSLDVWGSLHEGGDSLTASGKKSGIL